MFQTIPSFEHVLFYFSSVFFTYQLIFVFDLFDPCTVLNILCHRPLLFPSFCFFYFSDAVKAGYRE